MITLKILDKFDCQSQCKSKVMIDNNVDRMSVNILPFSLDRALSDVWRISPWTNLFNIFNRINQDQLVIVQFVAYGPTRIFCVKVSSQITGNGVLISYRTSDIIWNKTRLIGIINNWPGSGSGIWYDQIS